MSNKPEIWRTGPINYADVYDANGEIVALIPKNERAVDHARLIAAAPEMLAALKAYEALDEHRMVCEECSETLERAPEACGECFPFADDARLKMNAAIAKAEGL